MQTILYDMKALFASNARYLILLFVVCYVARETYTYHAPFWPSLAWGVCLGMLAAIGGALFARIAIYAGVEYVRYKQETARAAHRPRH